MDGGESRVEDIGGGGGVNFFSFSQFLISY